MSAQGGSLRRRGTIDLPIWPVAVLVIAVIAATIGMTMLRGDERLTNPAVAVREQGAWGSIGGPNEALHRQYSPPLEEVAPVAGPIMINGEVCRQCK
jgi:hypothetical protein